MTARPSVDEAEFLQRLADSVNARPHEEGMGEPESTEGGWSWPSPIGSDQPSTVFRTDPPSTGFNPLDAEHAAPRDADEAPQTVAAQARGTARTIKPYKRKQAHKGLPRLPAGEVQKAQVEFIGRADDYAALWLTGALLSIVTLGVYLPWARIRCRRYLMQHTRVAGQTLDYHGAPQPMLVRQFLGLVLLAGVGLAAAGSWAAGLLAALLAAAAWPLLHWMGLTHLVNRLTWGERPLNIEAPVSAVYRVAAWPWLLAAAWVGSAVWWAPQMGVLKWPIWGGTLALWLAALPLWIWNWLSLRQARGHLGPLTLSWKATRKDVYMAFAMALWWTVLGGGLVLGLAAVALAGIDALGWYVDARALLGLGVLFGLGMLVQGWSSVCARLFVLTWHHTGSRSLRFRCELSVPWMVRMAVQHALWTALTLGLYWPWAQATRWKVRVRSVSVHSRVDMQVLASRWAPRRGGAVRGRGR